MDLASIVITSIGIVFIMQLITIIMIARTLSALNKKREEPQSQSQQKFKRDKGKHNRKREDRPSESSAGQHAPQGASIDKSLREINLRLRNAERDQERARKSASPSVHSSSDSRRDNRNRRPNDKRRQHNRDNRGNRKNHDNRDNRGDWKRRDNRNNEPRPAQKTPPPPVEEKIEDSPSFEPVESQAAAAAEASQESLEHGRKVTVKRRVLRADEKGEMEQQPLVDSEENKAETQTDTASEPAATSEPAVEQAQPPQDDASQSQQEITFGRR